MKTKSIIISVLCFLFTISCSDIQHNDYPIKTVDIRNVTIADQLWTKRIKTNRDITIPHLFKQLEAEGIVRNLAIAGGFAKGEQCGNYPFDESDVYKCIEGASYVLMTNTDNKLDQYLDSLITMIRAAQEEDGYLYTARTNKAERFKHYMGEERWTNLSYSHELYNAGHLYEAAVAHYLATGKRELLNIAIKNADMIYNTFGPGKIESPPGHQEIELGLISLYKVTANKQYLELADFFIKERGQEHDGRALWGEYAQDHKPIIEQDEVVGHAVRSTYMNAILTDLSVLTGNVEYGEVVDRLWANLVGKKLHVTGGLGSVSFEEGFGENYELPNMSAYNETCASIANVMWQYRLFKKTGKAKYLDILERTLYNALLAGVGMDGKLFFYDNPLASAGQHERTVWKYCNCCISNLARFIPTLPKYVYSQGEEGIFINLFMESTVDFKIKKQTVTISQKTDYPWDGTVNVNIETKIPLQFTIYVRAPGWSLNKAIDSDLYRFENAEAIELYYQLNGLNYVAEYKNGFIEITRKWHNGDQLEFVFPMTINRIRANEKVTENRGKSAIQRGPLVYCAEGIDQAGGHVSNIILPVNTHLTYKNEHSLLEGIGSLYGEAIYSQFNSETAKLTKETGNFKAIPYFSWAHRGKHEMAVWFATEISAAMPLNRPPLIAHASVNSSGGKLFNAIRDGRYPRFPGEKNMTYFSWKAGKENVWIDFDFNNKQEIFKINVYWVSDVEFAPPASWKLLAWYKDEWHRVWNYNRQWGTKQYTFNESIFETVRTNKIRLEAIPDKDKLTGLYEVVLN